jgi:hypothetical protein
MSKNSTLAFHGLGQLESAIEIFKENQQKKKTIAAAEVEETTDSFTLQTKEIQKLNAASKLLSSELIGIAEHPVLFQKAYVSDTLDALFAKNGMTLGWMYQAYRVLKNAKLVGVESHRAAKVAAWISNHSAEGDMDVQMFLDSKFLSEDGEFYNWMFVGKPIKQGSYSYWLIVPSAIANAGATFFVKTWALLE